MNTVLFVGLLTVYMITCVGYYRNFVNDVDFMFRMKDLNKYGVLTALFLCAVLWPLVMVATLFFKGLSK